MQDPYSNLNTHVDYIYKKIGSKIGHIREILSLDILSVIQ